MKKILAICFLTAVTVTLNAQKTFTSKKEALDFLKETLSANFVKTAVIGKEDGKKFNDYNWYFEYKLTDEYLIVYRKSSDGPFGFSQKTDPSTQMKFNEISFVSGANKSKKFKNTPGLIFMNNGNPFGNRNKGIQEEMIINSYVHNLVNIPFNNANDEEVYKSVSNAIDAIAKENERVATESKRQNAESESKKRTLLIKQNANEYSVFPNYKIYTEDGTQKALPDYIEKNRRFKDKPTLVMTWAYNWCPPCIKKIDEILKADLAKKYNVILVNRNPETEISFPDIRVRLATKSPGYTTDAIVLFDRNGELAPMDANSAPIFLWLDKNLKIVGLYKSYAITTELIGETLLEVEKNTKN